MRRPAQEYGKTVNTRALVCGWNAAIWPCPTTERSCIRAQPVGHRWPKIIAFIFMLFRGGLCGGGMRWLPCSINRGHRLSETELMTASATIWLCPNHAKSLRMQVGTYTLLYVFGDLYCIFNLLQRIKQIKLHVLYISVIIITRR